MYRKTDAPFTGSSFWLAVQLMGMLAFTMGALGLAWGPLEAVTGLYSAPFWMYGVQVLLVVAVVLGLGRLFGGVLDRVTGKSGGIVQIGIVLTALSPLYSHSVVWGAFYHLPGYAVSRQATVIGSGYKHSSRAEADHGDWLEVRFAGEDRVRRFITRNTDMVFDGTYACPLDTAKAGDTLAIQGRETVFGFAATSFRPDSQRLVTACNDAPAQY
jgi:hypothetical protein